MPDPSKIGISVPSIRNKLRDIGFRHEREAWRCHIWKNGHNRVQLPKRDRIPIAQAIAILRQVDVSREEIEQFIRDAKA